MGWGRSRLSFCPWDTILRLEQRSDWPPDKAWEHPQEGVWPQLSRGGCWGPVTADCWPEAESPARSAGPEQAQQQADPCIAP